LSGASKKHIAKVAGKAAIGRRCFPWRLAIGLAAIPAGVLAIQPRNHFGAFTPVAVVVSLILVLSGLALRAWAAAVAGNHTRSGTIEAPSLVTGGPFAYVRNPIYLGSCVLGLGVVGLLGDLWLLIPHFAVFAVFFGAIVPAEENFLQHRFGDDYARYRRAVPKIIPSLRPWSARRSARPLWCAARGEVLIAALVTLIYGGLRIVVALKS